jgi:hypothetical protein
MESKYRYRNASDYEITGEPIPKDAKEKKAEYRKRGFGMKQIDGKWEWVRYTSEGKVENPDIADVYNTVLKMAKKRSLVDATITATAASDIFTQDVEDNAPEPEMRPAEDQETTPPEEPKPETDRAACLRLAQELGKPLDWLNKMKAVHGGDYKALREDLERELEAKNKPEEAKE